MNDIAFFRKARMNPFDPATVTVNGDPSQLQQIDAENLLKAADDLTDGTYWAKSNITVTDDGDGVFDLMETAGTSAVRQYLTNWMPRWAARVSLYIEVLAGSLDTGIIYLQQNATGVVDEVEIISGPAQY